MSKHLITDKPDNREFIRHPSDIPIEYCYSDRPLCVSDTIHDVSQGGLSFHSDSYIEPMQWLRLHIPICEEHFELDAQVRWCHPTGDGSTFNIGVLFATAANAYSARMVEQVCHIEHYKKQILLEEGRALSGDEAAAEWIEKYATSFPKAQSDLVCDDVAVARYLNQH